MNERIRELERQAIEYANQQNTFDPRSEFNKKFAELIVRECLDISKDVNRNPYIPDEDQARQIIKNITKHFGVEE